MKKAILISSVLMMISFLFTACNQSTKSTEMVKKEVFGTHDGKEVYLLTLTNKAGNVVKLTNYGAKINWIEVPDKNGKKDNITFGYETLEQTIKGNYSFGSVVGRYANRIGNARFTLDGVEYNTDKNDGPNTLHGGAKGFHSVVWNTEIVDGNEPAVKFTYLSPDMEEGFPGNLTAEITYTWKDNNSLVMDYRCTTDKKTVINITNHAYFNLHGAGNGNILDHELVLKASAYTPVDTFLIPTGELRPVEGTPFDFRTPHLIGERIDEKDQQLIYGKGYDHNYVLDNVDSVDVTVYDPSSGRVLEVLTDQPGMQFYSGNFLDGTEIGHGSKHYELRSGLCLESGHFPDSPNRPDFPSTTLNPGDTMKSTTIYRFSVK